MEDFELELNLFISFDILFDIELEEDVDIFEWVLFELLFDLVVVIGNFRFGKLILIQVCVILEIINGYDVIGKVFMGFGKILVFGIFIVEKWFVKQVEGNEDEKKYLIVMIFLLIRELVYQILDYLKKFSDGFIELFYICLVIGGLVIQKQLRQLEKVDIIIGIFGCLWEVISIEIVVMNLIRQIDFFVVDEVDCLFKDGQFKEVEDIIKVLDWMCFGEEVEEDLDFDEEFMFKYNCQILVFFVIFNKVFQQKFVGKVCYNFMGEVEFFEYLFKKFNFWEVKFKFIDVNFVFQMVDKLKEGFIYCGDFEKDFYFYVVFFF